MAQKRVMEIMHFALNPNGFMFLGGAESVEGSNDLFATIDKDARLFQSRSVTSRLTLPAADLSTLNRMGRLSRDQPSAEAPVRPRLSALDLHQRLLELYAPPSILVNDAYDIVHLSEHAGRYLVYAAGEPSHNVLKSIRPELRSDLRTALYQAVQQRTSIEARGVVVSMPEGRALVNLMVRPVPDKAEPTRGYFLLLFEEESAANAGSEPVTPVTHGDVTSQLEEELLEVRAQLRATAERHEAQTEELTASNEELQAMNEELRSSTEELETSKEELQSVNEELRTVNQELQTKIHEQAAATDDMQNLINSAEVGTIFLDRQSRIKLFTPRARDIFNLIPADRGRPLSDINSLLADGDLHRDVDTALEHLTRVEREIKTRDGRWQLMRIVPYRTRDNRIDGVVLTFVDITERKLNEDQLVALKEALESELTAMTLLHALSTRLIEGGGLQMLLNEVLNAAVEIQGADCATLQLYSEQTGRLQTVARHGFRPDLLSTEKTRQAYDEPGLAALKRRERIIIEDTETDPSYSPAHTVAAAAGYRTAYVTPLLGRRGAPLGVLTTHHRAFRPELKSKLTVLDLYARQAAEVIEFTRGQEALRASEDRLRRALEVETVGVLFFTSGGAVTQVNDAFVRMSGYTREEVESVGLLETLGGLGRTSEVARVLAEFEASGRIGAFENEFVHQDGSHWWGLIAAERIDEGAGVAFIIDVSAGQHGREQLRRSETRLRLIADSITEYAIVTIDPDGYIDTWSRGATKMFGFTEAEAVGQPASMLFTPEDRERGAAAEERRQARKLGRAVDERWHVRKDGSTFFVSGILAPLLDSTDGLIGYVKIARDLTERKHWEDALQRAHNQLEQRVRERTNALASANRALDLELRERRQADERIRGLMERLITVQEDERRRIARDLHDHLGQQVAGLSLKLQSVDHSLRSGHPESAVLADLYALIAKLDQDLDFLAWELRPPALDDLGLVVTLGNFVDEWSRNFGVPADFHTRGLDGIRMPYEIETNLYRVAQEALNNIYKHAAARRVGVMLERRDAHVVLVIEDDGKGFASAGSRMDNRDRGLGLLGMHERAALLGGSLDIETSPDTGTTVFVQVPLQVASERAEEDEA
jgi:PAS domain S-box-containing protein